MNRQAITYIDQMTGEKTTSLYHVTLAKFLEKDRQTVNMWVKRAEKQGGILTTKKFTLILSEFIKHGHGNPVD